MIYNPLFDAIERFIKWVDESWVYWTWLLTVGGSFAFAIYLHDWHFALLAVLIWIGLAPIVSAYERHWKKKRETKAGGK